MSDETFHIKNKGTTQEMNKKKDFFYYFRKKRS